MTPRYLSSSFLTRRNATLEPVEIQLRRQARKQPIGVCLPTQ